MVNDRGPYRGARDLDLSQGVAQQLGLIETGVDYVQVTYLGGSQAVEVPQAPVIDSPAAVVDPPPKTNVTQGLAHSGSYAVQTDDSLAGISAQLGTSADQLMLKNGISNPDLVYGGQTFFLKDVQHARIKEFASPAK